MLRLERSVVAMSLPSDRYRVLSEACRESQQSRRARNSLARRNSSFSSGVRRFSRRCASRCSSACKRRGNRLGVGQRDVAPHAVGARAQARRLSQRAPADRCDLFAARGIGAEGLLQQRGQRSREHLRQDGSPTRRSHRAARGRGPWCARRNCHPPAPLRFQRRRIGQSSGVKSHIAF